MKMNFTSYAEDAQSKIQKLNDELQLYLNWCYSRIHRNSIDDEFAVSEININEFMDIKCHVISYIERLNDILFEYLYLFIILNFHK